MVKYFSRIAVAVTIALSVAGCTESSDSTDIPKEKVSPETVQIMTEDASIVASGSRTDDGKRLIVSGTTNLPDGTELLISLGNESLGLQAQTRTIVKNGAFSTNPLELPSGFIDAEYLIEVIMPLPQTQTQEVQRVVGSKGEHLSGPLAQGSSLGGKLVKFETSYTVGTEEARRNTIEAHVELVSSLTATANDLLDKGREMERIRNTDNLTLLRECGEKMRQRQKVAKELRNTTDTLSSKYFGLKVAAVELNMCVSCSKTAMEACSRADQSLRGE